MLNPDMPAAELTLHMGEMTAQEIRTARAAIRWANAAHDEGVVVHGHISDVSLRNAYDGRSFVISPEPENRTPITVKLFPPGVEPCENKS